MKIEKMKPELIIREDGVYEITLLCKPEDLYFLIKDSYGDRTNIQHEIIQLFAKEYVKKNFDAISNLIDMETVKLLATRKLAGVVANNT